MPLKAATRALVSIVLRTFRNSIPLLGVLLTAVSVRAQNETRFWPELDTYVKVSPRTRLFFIAALSSDQDSRQWEGEFGPNFDFYVKPFLRPNLRDMDPAKSRLLSFRVGYRYLTTFGTAEPGENRMITEGTGRFKVPCKVLLSDRNRFDFRFISEQSFSWRYRNRITGERNFLIRKYEFTSYLRGELFYDSRSEKIAKNVFTVGSVFPVSKRSEFEMYYEDQRDSSSTSNFHTRGPGVVLSLYF